MVMRADETAGEQRPRTRGECPPREEGFEHRRCGFVGCRHHNAITVHPSGRISINARFKLDDDGFDVDAIDREACCSLDVADAGSHVFMDLGHILGVSHERVRQIWERAKKRMSVNGGIALLSGHLDRAPRPVKIKDVGELSEEEPPKKRLITCEVERLRAAQELAKEKAAVERRRARDRKARRELRRERGRMTTLLAGRALHLEATANARAIEVVDAAIAGHRERFASPVEHLIRSQVGVAFERYDMLSPWSSLSAGQRVRRIRLRLGWSQVDLAERAGVGKRHLDELERGRSKDAGKAVTTATGVLAFLCVPDALLLCDTHDGAPPLNDLRRPEKEPPRGGKRSNLLRVEWLLGLTRVSGVQRFELMRRSTNLNDMMVDRAAGVPVGTTLKVELGIKVGGVRREKVLRVVMARARV